MKLAHNYFVFLFSTIFILLIFNDHILAKATNLSNENFGFELEIQGDLTEKYSISGLVNGSGEFTSTLNDSKCKISISNRKVLRSKKLNLEIWPELKCTLQGQNKVFKISRIFVPIQELPIKHTVRSLAPDLQNIVFVFSNISISSKK